MHKPWTECAPRLRGELVTLREIEPFDVNPLHALFSDPAVTTHMAPPPPTLPKFAGFVVWSHEQRRQGRGICFGVVPDGMATAVGILQLRSLDSMSRSAEWGFVLGADFWSTGVFADAASLLVDFVFTTLHVDRLEARVGLRNERAHAAVKKLGARSEATIAMPSPAGILRDPEVLWALREDEWRNRERGRRRPDAEATQLLRAAVEAAQRHVHETEHPQTVEPYPLFLFDRRRRE